MLYPTEENLLETSLRLAANDPSFRPDFYKTLLESTVFIIHHAEHPREGKRRLEAGEKIAIVHWKRDDMFIIPFFSSLAALQLSIPDEVTTYMALPARNLFEMASGVALALNPKLAYGKEFLPNEIKALLSVGVNRVNEEYIAGESTQALLGQPAHYPEKMVDALKSLFSRRKDVKAAYLAMMQIPSRGDDRPHLVVGIDADHDIESIMREAGSVAGDTKPDGEIVDLYQIHPDDDDVVSHYLTNDVTPFYQRP